MAIKTGIYRHVVLFQFNEGVPEATIQSIEAAFRALSAPNCPSSRTSSGPRIPASRISSEGFTHCFIVTFADAQGRDVLPAAPGAHGVLHEVSGPESQEGLRRRFRCQRLSAERQACEANQNKAFEAYPRSAVPRAFPARQAEEIAFPCAFQPCRTRNRPSRCANSSHPRNCRTVGGLQARCAQRVQCPPLNAARHRHTARSPTPDRPHVSCPRNPRLLQRSPLQRL